MTQKNILFLLLAVFLLLAISGCKERTNIGTLTGNVTIGPMCPEDSDTIKADCKVTELVYKQWHVELYTMDLRTKVGDINPDITGKYSIDLPDGDYMLQLERSGRAGNNNFPIRVTVYAGKITEFDIKINPGVI